MGEPVDELVAELARDGYVFPDHGADSIVNVVPTALSLVDAQPAGTGTLSPPLRDRLPTAGIDHVILLVVDGLGFDEWTRVGSGIPTLHGLAAAGTVAPLSSIFPSETAAAIPSIHTGVPPVEHGLLGWHQHLPSVGMAVQALPWTTQTDEPIEDAVASPPEWADVFLDATPLYDRVDIATNVIQPATIADSTSSQALTHGVDARIGATNFVDALVAARRQLQAADGRSFSLVYLGDVDAIAHRDGPGGDAGRAQAGAIGDAIRRELCHALDDPLAERTALLVTADHGLTATAGHDVDIRDYAPIYQNLATDAEGNPIPPVGGARNLQFFIREGRRQPVRDHMRDAFECLAFTRAEYEALELFGRGRPSPGYEQRAPDVLCIPRQGGLCTSQASLDHRGKHGGLSREEMIVPLAAARISDLAQHVG